MEFSTESKKVKNKLNSIRHSGKKVDSFERIVFDFYVGDIPQIYAHVEQATGKLQIDFLRTKTK